MQKIAFFITSITFIFAMSTSLIASTPLITEITDEIPEISITGFETGFEKVANVAQYKEADWTQAIGIAKGISIQEAYEIAKNDPNITFFFYTKGFRMVLERTDGTYRLFNHGDTVFFTGEPWWGSAPGLADGYIKNAE